MSGPVTTETTLREFKSADWIDDGYEFLAVGVEHGWRSVASWGSDGWDLGSWPYVVVMFRERTTGVVAVNALPEPSPAVWHDKEFQRAIYVEGDITIETYATAEDRERATDETAMFYWKSDGAPWLDRPEADLRGPYVRGRSA